MTRRERLRASIEGRGVDRPPVCFDEINGYDEKPDGRKRNWGKALTTRFILKTAVEGLYFGFSFGGRGCPPSMKRLFWGRKNAHFQGEKAVPGTANLPIGTVKSP